jgi:hypothetical protein
MKAKALPGIAVVLISCWVFAAMYRPSPAQEKEPKARAAAKWEYKRWGGDLSNEKLTALGEEGWELVSMFPGQPYVTDFTSRPAGAGSIRTDNSIRYTQALFLFKRPK